MRSSAKRRGKIIKPAERRGVAFKLPDDLLIDLDAIAAQEGRSRAKQIEMFLRQSVQSYRQRRDAA